VSVHKGHAVVHPQETHEFPDRLLRLYVFLTA